MSRNGILKIFVFFSIAFSAAPTPSAHAQQEAGEIAQNGVSCPGPCPATPDHFLGDHNYLPSLLLDTPFADTQLTIAMAFGYGNYASLFPSLGLSNLQLGIFAPDVSGQVRIIPKLAVEFGFSGNVIVGINTASALQFGGQTTYNVKLGGLYELLRGDNDLLTVGLQYLHPHTLAVSPLNGIITGAQAAIGNSLGSGDANFTSSSVTDRWRPNLRYGHTFDPTFAMQALLGLLLDSQTDNTGAQSNSALLQIGLGFQADLKPQTNVPIGFTVEYQRGQTLATATNSDTLLGGIFETSSTQFSFGIEYGAAFTGANTSNLGVLLIRSYWN